MWKIKRVTLMILYSKWKHDIHAIIKIDLYNLMNDLSEKKTQINHKSITCGERISFLLTLKLEHRFIQDKI